MKEVLSHEEPVTIRFHEVDALGIVWHGHYAKYFEDGREGFGRKFGIGYMDIFAQGYLAPLVTLEFNYRKSLKYGDRIRVHTAYEPSQAAKIIFHYTLYRNNESDPVATGRSVQVFVDREEQSLQLVSPVFFDQWKQLNQV